MADHVRGRSVLIPVILMSGVEDADVRCKEAGKGTGQGLHIARSIVATKHNGSLTFESEVGKGTTFTIRLPIGNSDASKDGA
ncbi:MAG: ATP-binding protein [Polyangia bacterium]|jgi:signal transduction histidine kinase